MPRVSFNPQNILVVFLTLFTTLVASADAPQTLADILAQVFADAGNIQMALHTLGPAVLSASNSTGNSNSIGPAGTPTAAEPAPTESAAPAKPKSCFPALDFDKPNDVPKSRDNWWCQADTEYAFFGFSYEGSQFHYGLLDDLWS